MDLDKLKKMLTIHEGYKLKLYVDTVGKATIGVGHNLTDKGLTARQVDNILNDDVSEVLTFLNGQSWFTALDDVRARAIADMTFNLMRKVLDFKTMIAALEHQAWDEAADALLNSQFARQVGQRVLDLSLMLRTGRDQ